MNDKRYLLALLLALLCGTPGRVFALNSLSAAEPVGRPPELTLAPGCRDCVSVEEVDFALHIGCPDGKPLSVTSSRLILMGESGEVLASVEDPYRLNGRSEKDISISGGISSELREILACFAATSFSAILKVNDLYSNVVRFNIRADLRKPSSPGKDCQGSLEIEPIVEFDGRERPNFLLAYFRNESSARIDTSLLWEGSRLLVDGDEFHLAMMIWIGFTGLGPGRSWGHIVELASFWDQRKQAISPGTHEIQHSLGGCRSNTIRIKVEK